MLQRRSPCFEHPGFGRVREAAHAQGGVLSRPQLYALGLTRWMVEAQVRAGRWHRTGVQTLFVLDAMGSPDPDVADWWRAVLEVGPGAALDGVTALQVAGLQGYDQPVVQVSVPKSRHFRRPDGVRVYETRRRRPEDLVPVGLPRVRPAVGAVRGALWAATTRRAALILVMTVQQRLTTADQIGTELEAASSGTRGAGSCWW